jgi:hypothetical protein
VDRQTAFYQKLRLGAPAWQGHAGAWPVTGGYCYLLQSLTTSSWHGELDMVPVSVSFKHVIA